MGKTWDASESPGRVSVLLSHLVFVLMVETVWGRMGVGVSAQDLAWLRLP